MAGGIPIALSLEIKRDERGLIDSYEIPWNDLQTAINPKTRLIIVNTPHNPTGMVWQASDLDRLAGVVRNFNTLILSDEVYEHMVYDGAIHHSIASHPELLARSFVISSFGKTYHVTGWKVGYVVAPAPMMAEFRKVHQFNVFTVNTPMQYGLAHYLGEPRHYLNLPGFYQIKRDYFAAGLQNTRFKLLRCQGAYFQCVDYSGLGIPQSKLNEFDFCTWLTAEVGVAAIPISAFYNKEAESCVIRFCFAKQEVTLKKALERLNRL